MVREDASQMCALQIQAEHASTLNDNEEQIMLCIEKYITKQVRRRCGGGGRIGRRGAAGASKRGGAAGTINSCNLAARPNGACPM